MCVVCFLGGRGVVVGLIGLGSFFFGALEGLGFIWSFAAVEACVSLPLFFRVFFFVCVEGGGMGVGVGVWEL